MNNYENLGKGLRKIYVAEIGAVICAVLMLFPVVNIAAMAGLVIFCVIKLIGLYSACKDVKGCMISFVLTILCMPLPVVQYFVYIPLSVRFIYTIICAVVPVVASCIMFYSVSKVFEKMEETFLARQGMNTMWIYLICEIAGAFLEGYTDAMGRLMLVTLMTLGVAILSLVYQLKFLKAGAEQLGYYVNF